MQYKIFAANLLGGIDAAINRLLSTPFKDIQADVRSAIAERYVGEQPVGTSIIVPAHAGVEYLAYAPTMRIPENSANTLNAYLAFRAVLVDVRRHEPKIKTLICSSLCTGAGEMNPTVAAAQMKLAWLSVFVEDVKPKPDWRHIREFHRLLSATLHLNKGYRPKFTT